MLELSNRPSHIKSLDDQERYWAYNGLDTCITAEVGAALLPMMDKNQQAIYDFERTCRAPALQMQILGFRIDEPERRKLHRERKADGKRWQRELDVIVKKIRQEDRISWRGDLQIAKDDYLYTKALVEGEKGKELRKKGRKTLTVMRQAIKQLELSVEKTLGFQWGKGLPPSTKQLQDFIFNDMGVPEQTNHKGIVSMDKEVCKRVRKKFPKTKECIDLVLKLRDWQKQIEVLDEKNLSSDGRFRASFAVGQTETGRWSSTADVYKQGDNLQNKDRRIRRIFLADVGKRFLNVDLSQAESCCIAHLAGDQAYIDAHDTGNVHVVAGRIFWPDLSWTGDDKTDKMMMKQTPVSWIAQAPVKPGEEPAFHYYDMAKRAQHGLNYGLTEYGLAIWLGVTRIEALRLLQAYFGRYFMLPEYHKFIKHVIKTKGVITSPLGRTRQFFGRPWDKATVREALANTPQGMTVDILDIALLRIWHHMVPDKVTLHQQGHDAILSQAVADETTLPAIRTEIMEHMIVPVPVEGLDGVTRTMVIPAEMEEGTNWRDLK